MTYNIINMKLLKLLFIYFIGTFLDRAQSINRLLTYTARIHKLTFHPDIYGNYIISQYGDNEYINGNFIINSSRSININKMVVVFERCNPEGINCEYFQSWTLTDLCSKLKEKNQIWSTIYGAFEPPLTCPFVEKHYKVNNATIDMNTVTLLYPEAVNYQWRVTQTFYGNDIRIGGYTVSISIFSFRKRNTKSSQLSRN